MQINHSNNIHVQCLITGYTYPRTPPNSTPSNALSLQEVTKYLKSMEEAIKRGEFQELPEDVIAAKCTQTCAVQTKLWSDTISGDKETPDSQPEEKPVSPASIPSPPPLKQASHINKIKPPKRKLGRPRKVLNSPVMPALEMMGVDGVVKLEPVVKSESAIKTEKAECPGYIKHEPMDVVVDQKPTVNVSSSQPNTSESSGTQNRPNNGQNMNIDIENIGNLESLFVMLHKDTEDDSENIDVNSFLANL